MKPTPGRMKKGSWPIGSRCQRVCFLFIKRLWLDPPKNLFWGELRVQSLISKLTARDQVKCMCMHCFATLSPSSNHKTISRKSETPI
jgi:hypothetical protein